MCVIDGKGPRIAEPATTVPSPPFASLPRSVIRYSLTGQLRRASTTTPAFERSRLLMLDESCVRAERSAGRLAIPPSRALTSRH